MSKQQSEHVNLHERVDALERRVREGLGRAEIHERLDILQQQIDLLKERLNWLEEGK